MTLARRLLLAGVGSGSFVPFAGPYSPTIPVGETVLTQLHCHTSGSYDGSISPADVVDGYLAAGYGALQLTDHDLVTAQPAGITSAIDGNELTTAGFHLITINSTYTRGAETDAQAMIDGVRATGGDVQVAHPLYVAGMSYATMAALTGYAGLEVHNGLVVTGAGADPVTYPGFAVARWDALLSGVRRDLWAFAVDDLHATSAFMTYDVGRVQVFAESNTPASVAARIHSGCFVADVSNYGVTPGYPLRASDGVSLTCAGAVRIEAWGAAGLLDSAAGTSLTYGFTGSEQYVRLVAVGDYTEGFGAALSDRWATYDGTWTVGSGVVALSGGDATPRRLILRRQRQGDFTAQVDIRLGTGTLSGAALMFNVLDADHYYILRIGESGVSGWDGVLAVGYTTTDGFASPPLDSYALAATEGTFYTVKMAYAAATGTIQAKAWETGTSEPGGWQVEVSDTTWTHGAFGFRGTFDVAYDNLHISGFETFYQPIAV